LQVVIAHLVLWVMLTCEQAVVVLWLVGQSMWMVADLWAEVAVYLSEEVWVRLEVT